MKKFFVFALAISALTACQKEAPLSQPSTTKLQSNRSSHTVPVEKALRELNQFLSGGQTRGTDPRHVTNVQTVSGAQLFPMRTRAEKLPDLEDVFYIAHFKEGEGCAILAADDRLASVQAVLDSDDFTPEQLANIAKMTPEQAIEAHVSPINELVQLTKAKLSYLTDAPKSTRIVGGKQLVRVEYTVNRYNYDASRGFPPAPFVPMQVRWHQGSPFNAQMPIDPTSADKKPFSPGSGAIAAAHLLIANRNKQKPVAVGGRSIDWNLIDKAINNPDLLKPGRGGNNTIEAKAVAQFVWALYAILQPNFPTGTGRTNMDKMTDLLRNTSYKDVTVQPFAANGAAIKEMLYGRKFATIACSENNEHFWIMDAWMEQVGTKVEIYSDGSRSGNIPFTRLLFHSNFGWGGDADGFYPADNTTLDLTYEPVNWYEQEGGFSGVGQIHYLHGYQTLQYRF